MKSIILAAGRGSRIPKFSKRKPKCLILINGKSILKRQIDFFKRLKIKKIVVVRGYKKKFINFKKIKFINNKNYKNSEQLQSLFSAKSELDEDVIISFSDIIYDFNILKKLYFSEVGNIILAIDRKWKQRYKFRFDHPVAQADKVELDKKNLIRSIGKNILIKKTHAEFLGLIKIRKEATKIFINFFKKLKKRKLHKMQIHHFVNYLVNNKIKVNACEVSGKYMEIDTYNDYKIAKKIFRKKNNA